MLAKRSQHARVMEGRNLGTLFSLARGGMRQEMFQNFARNGET